MNTISENLLQAFSILADEKIKELKFDQTIQAEVVSLVNLDTGEYKVKYNGNTFSAFSNDLKYQYRIGTHVLVKIPEGDFSSKKIIENTVSNKTLSEQEFASVNNKVIEISPGFEAFYKYPNQERFGVVAGAPITNPEGYKYIFKNSDKYSHSTGNELFQQYANNYELIQIQASFSTMLHSIHNKGNYGIEVEFYTKGDSTVTYKLDFSSFIGDPYRYYNFSIQSSIIKVQKNYLLGLKSIKLFQEHFDYDRYVLNGLETTDQNTTINNIFVKDVNIKYIELQDAKDSLYHLSISTPEGTAFTNEVNTLRLIGRLVYQGNSILTEETSQCKWFKRNLSVMTGDERYDKDAGFGWENITGDFNTLTINKENVKYQQEYKLVAIYNKDIVTSAQILITNNESDYLCQIEQVTENDNIKLYIHNLKNSQVLKGDWYMSLPDGSYQKVPNGEKINEIFIKEYLLYTSVTFYCAVYNYDSTEIIANLEHLMVNSESKDDLQIQYIGEDAFRYDANGDITIEDSEKERTLKIQVTWKDGTGTSYLVRWIGPDGNQLKPGASRYSPSNSMLDNLWIDNNNILHYTIKQKYRINYNNNVITLKIITLDEKEYIFKKEIIFMKDGDQGTNGTTYIAAIRPCDSSGNKLSGLHPLIYNNGWGSILRLKAYVYTDGQLINSNPKYSISYQWTGTNNISFGSTSSEQININGNGSISSSSNSKDLEFYVKLQITIRDNINGKTIILYPNYPVDIAVGGINYNNINIDDIPSYIKYTTSGTNPSYYSNALKFTYQNTDYTKNIVSLNESVLKINDRENGERYLRPASKFTFDESSNKSNIGVLKCSISSNQYLIHPIFMFLDVYGNEAINGWDGTKLKIDDNGKYLFAPQIGAGIKDTANTFTGIVMGEDSQQRKIGLYGYQKGINTFGLMEDGTAFFGASGAGRINIDGNSAMIYGGLSHGGANSMTLTLKNTSLSSTSYAIQVKDSYNSNAFYVRYDGKMFANNVEISGNITATTLTATSGTIGDFNISRDGLSGGTINCKRIVADRGGTIGGWEITSRGLESYNGRTVLNKNGDITIDGTLTASDVDLSGEINADGGSIGSWRIDRGDLYNDPTYLYGDGTISTEAITITGLGDRGRSDGTLGLVYGNDGESRTNNLGLESRDRDVSIVLDSNNNIRLSASGNIYLDARQIHFLGDVVGLDPKEKEK